MKDFLQAFKKKFLVSTQFIQNKFIAFTIPSNQLSFTTGTLSDLPKSKSQLLGKCAR